jgi:hypothetical protein
MRTCERQRLGTRLLGAIFITALLLICSASETRVAAQGVVRLVPIGSGAKVKLIYQKKSVVVNMEEEARDTLPGNAPHRYKVLFSTAKDGFVYVLAQVCSGSPISNPNAPCGGDRPCALLWIKADRNLANREIKSEIYSSCSYNYSSVGRIRIAHGKATIFYRKGIDERTELIYDNSEPEKGIVVKKVWVDQN